MMRQDLGGTRVSGDELLKVGGSHQQLPTPPFSPQMSRRTTSVTSDTSPSLQDANINIGKKIVRRQVHFEAACSDQPRRAYCYQTDLVPSAAQLGYNIHK